MTYQPYCTVCLLLVTGFIAVQGQLTTSTTCPEVSKCLDDLELRIKINEQFKASFKSQAELAKLTVANFYVSSAFNGRRYYLRKDASSKFNTIFAEDVCQSLGGNLAEIDNAEELKFLQAFVSSYPFSIVYISGTDEKQENVWMNPFKNTPIKYVGFGWSEPNGGITENCLGLWKTFNFDYTVDSPCAGMDNGSFLCEVPQ